MTRTFKKTLTVMLLLLGLMPWWMPHVLVIVTDMEWNIASEYVAYCFAFVFWPLLFILATFFVAGKK